LCIDVLEAAAPGLRDSVLHAELLTPLDIEREFRIEGVTGTMVSWPSTSSSWFAPYPEPRNTHTDARSLPVRRRLSSGGRGHGTPGRNAAQQALKGGVA